MRRAISKWLGTHPVGHEVDEAVVAEEGEAEVVDAKARAGVTMPVKRRLMLCNKSRQRLKMF